MHRIAAVVAIVAGVGLIAVTLALSLFPRTAGAERVTDTFRPAMTEQGLAKVATDFGTVRDGGQQLLNGVVPTFRRKLGMSPAEFNAFLGKNFPAVAVAAPKLPGYNSYVGGYIKRLKANRDNFEAADSLPGAGLPITATPWLIVAVGALLVLAGAAGLRSTGQAGVLAILLLGVLMVAAPLVLSLPSKASDAKDIVVVGRDGLSQQKAALAKTGAREVDNAVREINGKLLPALAARLKTPPAALNRQLGSSFPATAKFLKAWPESLGAVGFAIAANQQARVDDFAKANKIPFKALPWILIAPGILVALLGALALFVDGDGRTRAAPAYVPSN